MKLRVGGVPEHFNLPWHLCIENGEFDEIAIDLQWTDVPEGTGKMCQMLREGETDIAVILSEGIVKDIAAGNGRAWLSQPAFLLRNLDARPRVAAIRHRRAEEALPERDRAR